MANIPSALKRARQATKLRTKNRAEKSKILTIRKKMQAAISAGDKAKSKTIFSEYCSALDKSNKHGVLKANTADRLKSRGAARLAKLV